MTARTDLAGIEGEGKGDHWASHDRALGAGEREHWNRLAGTGREAEWIALVCLHSGFLSGLNFVNYFNTDRKQLSGLSGHWWRGRGGIEGDSMMFPVALDCAGFSNMAIYRALGVENIRHRRKARNSVLMRRSCRLILSWNIRG